MLMLAAAVWAALAVPVAVAIGRAIRHADLETARTPQLDVPLWRGTDLDPPAPIDGPEANLAGAILALSFATDETTARYWLAMCARRGADATTLRDLRAEWDRQHATDVQTLHTDPADHLCGCQHTSAPPCSHCTDCTDPRCTDRGEI